jgi:hypothetical protein
MSTRRQWRDFVRLNPEYTWLAHQQGVGEFRPPALSREVGTTVAWALVDENHGTPAERAAAIGKRATLAQQRGQAREAREAQLEARFAELNPEFGVLPSRTDPQQHRFAHRRERALALGTRVHLAEARENTGTPELAAWHIRERALRAVRQTRDQRIQRQPAERAGAER